MSTLSLFDIIGPNMVGPSSSHTAGALAISRMAIAQLDGAITSVTFTLYGSFANTYEGHGTDKALLGGVLGYDTADPRIKQAFAHAKASGIDYAFVPDFETDADHPNTVDITIRTATGYTRVVRGISTGGGAAELVFSTSCDTPMSKVEVSPQYL